MDGRADVYPLVAHGRLLALVQKQAVYLSMTFLGGTSIRAHHKAASAARDLTLRHSETIVKRLAGLVAAMEPKHA